MMSHSSSSCIEISAQRRFSWSMIALMWSGAIMKNPTRNLAKDFAWCRVSADWDRYHYAFGMYCLCMDDGKVFSMEPRTNGNSQGGNSSRHHSGFKGCLHRALIKPNLRQRGGRSVMGIKPGSPAPNP